MTMTPWRGGARFATWMIAVLAGTMVIGCGVGNAEKSARSGHHHPYVGMWVTADGHVRQELLPDGRYDEARGTRESAYTGSYEVRGNRIDYRDDTGFTADGTFVTDNELHHGGMVFHRR